MIKKIPENKFKKYWGWSFTKENLFKSCPLAYYYKYIYQWEAKQYDTQANIDYHKKIKKLRTIKMISGTHINYLIREILNGRLMPDIDHVHDIYINRMTESYNKGEDNILEIFHNIFSDNLYGKTIESGLLALENFIKLEFPKISELKYEIIDKLKKLNINNRAYYSAPDLFAQINDRLYYLIDWKSGAGNNYCNNSIEMQLLPYAYFIITQNQHRQLSECKFVMKIIYLQNPNNGLKKIFTGNKILEMANEIEKRHDELYILSLNGPFKAKPERMKCLYCNFATLCKNGIEYIPSFRKTL